MYVEVVMKWLVTVAITKKAMCNVYSLGNQKCDTDSVADYGFQRRWQTDIQCHFSSIEYFKVL